VALLLDILKAIGAISTAAFGMYGVGVKTRDEDGNITRAGVVAVTGIAASLLVAMASVVVESYQRERGAQEEARKYEQLTRNALYASLSTDRATISVSLSIDAITLAAVAPKYFSRLRAALATRAACKVSESTPRYRTVYECSGYTVESYDLLGDSVTFRTGSSLLPTREQDPAAHALLESAGVYLVVDPARLERASILDRDPLYFRPSALAPTYTFKDDILFIASNDQPLERNLLVDQNVSSIVDLLGKKLELSTQTSFSCSKAFRDSNPQECEVLQSYFKDGLKLERFAIRFPHRRDLVFDKSSYRNMFSETSRKNTFSATVPETVENFPLSDKIAQSKREQ
jgi:hypothetical protein